MDAQLPSKLPFSKKRLRARIVLSYISDYVILIALIIGFFILDRVEPFHQPFALQNYTLHYPYAVNERVPIPLALAISGGFPVLVIVVYTIVLDGLFSHSKPVNIATGKRADGNRGEVWKAFIVMVPTLSAGLVAVTRIMDARHHPFDVISGSLLGVGCGWVAYRQYFPSLAEPWKKGRAHPIRTWGSIPEPPVYTHRRLLEYENDQAKLVPRADEEYQAAQAAQEQARAHEIPESAPALMSNPFEHQKTQRRRRLADTDYGASSSESEGYEMQQTRYEPRHHQAADTSSDAAPRYAAYHPPDNRTPSNSPPLERHPASIVKS
ncbi:PAP2 domain-containing protein [Trichophyton equinum CBS 127.97]|uniref:PAP2 domain-containing protein n=1 Tax=Trichophyton equinum (strain ATCC MYA-4606 / CBS 127.97) TaxID=559882 RepID=F2PI10_TRIEC|nr:PAP2 domain-containing protein [Trichophyton equinum CBS 127.97]